MGKANVDGTNVNNHLIPNAAPLGVAVDAQHIYWSIQLGPVARANLDGSNVKGLHREWCRI
jgi:hypothetical protein